MPGPTLDSTSHQARAARHAKIGEMLVEAGDEWGAVCCFYAAYHHVKAALLEDPIFDDPTRMHDRHLDLVADDRFTDRHKGRRNTGRGREWGINELVGLLYPQIRREYEQLHQASIDVRYGSGLRSGALPAVTSALTAIENEANTGLRAS